MELSNNYLHSWTSEGHDFAIRRAVPSDGAAVLHVAQEAFFAQADRAYYRDMSKKQDYAKNDVPKRLNNPDAYSVYVCVERNRDGEKVVGTGYLQTGSEKCPVDYPGKAEAGQLSVLPAYQQKHGIAPRMMMVGLRQAQQMRISTIYCYIVDSIGEYNQNGLERLYGKAGFWVTGRKLSGGQKHPRFVSKENPEGRVPLIVLERGLTVCAHMNVIARSLKPKVWTKVCQPFSYVRDLMLKALLPDIRPSFAP